MPTVVAFLERLCAEERSGDLAGDGDDGSRVHLGGGEAGHEVGRARTGGCNANADFSRKPGVGFGGVGGGLFVPHEDMAQLGVVPKGVIEGENGPAGMAEEDINAFAEEGFADCNGTDGSHILFLCCVEAMADRSWPTVRVALKRRSG